MIKGPTDTPYYGGSYHGKLIFPSEYPYKPPAIMMLTPKCARRFSPTGVGLVARGKDRARIRPPARADDSAPASCAAVRSGRFNTNTRLCLSMSDFHPETWVPAWSVASILNGVLSFMLESTPTVGSVETSVAERRRLAAASHAFNRKTPLFCELFPEQVVQADAEPSAGEAGADGGADGGGAGGAAQQHDGEQQAYPAYLAIAGVVMLAVAFSALNRLEL